MPVGIMASMVYCISVKNHDDLACISGIRKAVITEIVAKRTARSKENDYG